MPRSRLRSRARWILAGTLALIVVVVLVIVLSGSSPTTGFDVSYPQCSGSYPSNPLFGIVGVNGGLANKANPCLSGELRWAGHAPGQKSPVRTTDDDREPKDHSPRVRIDKDTEFKFGTGGIGLGRKF